MAHLHLNGLHPADALALTRHAGVKVHDERVFTSFVGTFGGHSLLVKLVAGRINKFRRARGDFDAWYAAEGRTLTISDYDLRQHQTHILQYAFTGLAPEALRFLSQIAAFGDAVEYKVLEIFNPFVLPAPEVVAKPDNRYKERRRDTAETEEERHAWQQYIDNANAPYHAYLEAKAEHDAYLKSPTYRKALTQFDALLSELEERGLLRWEADKDRYDMHPVVRGTLLREDQPKPKTLNSVDSDKRYPLSGLSPEALYMLSQFVACGATLSYAMMSAFNPFVRPMPELMKQPSYRYEEHMRDNAHSPEDRQYYQQIIDELNARYKLNQKQHEEYVIYKNLRSIGTLLLNLINYYLIWNQEVLCV